MEQARLLLAIVLSLLVFLVWQFVFVKPQVDQNFQNAQPSQESSAVNSSEESSDRTSETQEATAENTIPAIPVDEDGAARTITIETPKYKTRISEDGAGIISFVLKDFFESIDPGAARKELIPPNSKLTNVTLFLEKNSVADLENKRFRSLSEEDTINVMDQPYELRFISNSKEGVQIEKTFIFHPDNYLIDLDITIRNQSGAAFSDQIGLALSKMNIDPQQSYIFEGPSALIDGNHEQVKIKKDEVPDGLNGAIQWIAFEDRYFMSGIIAKQPEKATMRVKVGADKIFNQYIGPKIEIDSGGQKTYQYAVFFGPKKKTLLDSLNYELNRVIDFGFFDFIAKPFLWFMNFIYSIIPNYGVAIIILTIMTKILTWPLGNKSYKSMSEMKRLQPLMEEIRQKYKNDKTKMNQEIMGLYRTYKINPLGGCLPMILQIPVFFALYRMLYQAIELRHAPFIWWINDLSAPDRLFQFDFSIPFMQPPYGIPVLTIIMGATMLLQQKLSPPPGDPAQAKMMMIMPVVFTFIFINFSSGLVLYWLVNNILSIGQQYYIQKKYA